MPEYAIESQVKAVTVVEAESLHEAMEAFNGNEELHGEILSKAVPEIISVEDNKLGLTLYVKDTNPMPLDTLATRLEDGINADIFYDADDYGDDGAQEVIEDFQAAVHEAIDALRNERLFGQNVLVSIKAARAALMQNATYPADVQYALSCINDALNAIENAPKTVSDDQSRMLERCNKDRCPVCNGGNVDYDAIDTTDMAQDAKCNACGARWEEKLGTVGVTINDEE